jgi:hypothetical protein
MIVAAGLVNAALRPELLVRVWALSQRVPDAMQRSPGDAQHRPVTLLRGAGTH